MKKSVLYLGLLISICYASDDLQQLAALAERDQQPALKKQPSDSDLAALQAWENQGGYVSEEELPTVEAEHAGSPTTPHAPSAPVNILNPGIKNPAGFSYNITVFGNPSDPSEFKRMQDDMNQRKNHYTPTPYATPDTTPVGSARQSPRQSPVSSPGVFVMDEENNYN